MATDREPERVAKLRQLYDMFNRRDFDRALAALDPAAEHDTTRVFPDGRVYRGRDEIRGYWQESLDRWGDGFHLEPQEFIEAGDLVVTVCRMRIRGAESGVPLELPFVHLWTFRDGKIVRGCNFADRDEALRAAGPEHPAGTA